MARVTLTFDNGPDPEGTPRVLEALKRRGLEATFFVLGRNLESQQGQDLARRIADGGHRLGNHTYSHTIPLGQDLRPDAVELELERTQLLLEQVGTPDRLFRPYGGQGRIGPHLLSPRALDWLQARRMTCVLWNAVPGDFRDGEGWVEPGLLQVRGQEHALVVLHDAKPTAMRHLDRFLDALEAEGHTFERDFPDGCLPVQNGIARAGIEALVQPPSAARTA